MTEKRTPAEMFASISTPIFTAEMGDRMALARMKMLLDQRELGTRLGISQQQVSKLEQGKVRVLEKPFTLEQFLKVFGKSSSFVLFGTGEDNFPRSIRLTYWEEKSAAKGNRVPRTPFWESNK
jgi:transcriptional regulator with XRE-family HTH domain